MAYRLLRYITEDKMLGLKILSVSVIHNLIALLLIVFIISIVIKYLNDRKKKRMDSEISVKVDSYLNQHITKTEDEQKDK